MTNKSMYRYLEKYQGKYRVLGEYDLNTNDFPRGPDGSIDDTYEDLYIPCKRGCVVKHTYEDNILAICVYGRLGLFHNLCDALKEKYSDLDLKIEEAGCDGIIYFNDKDFDKVATIIKPRTSGAKIKWFSKKNLPNKSIKIPADKLKVYQDIMKDLDKPMKMKFGREIIPEFIEYKHVKRKLEDSRLKPREFIYDSGLWDEFVKFAEKKVKTYE
jgi:hypothetical protein